MLQSSIEEGVSALGKNTFQIQKWPAIRNNNTNWAAIRNRKDISFEDYNRLKETLKDARYVGAEQWAFGKKAKYGNKETNPALWNKRVLLESHLPLPLLKNLPFIPTFQVTG